MWSVGYFELACHSVNELDVPQGWLEKHGSDITRRVVHIMQAFFYPLVGRGGCLRGGG